MSDTLGGARWRCRGLVEILLQRPAQDADEGGERLLAHHGVGPDGGEQLLLKNDHLPGMADQLPEHGQSFGGKFTPRSSPLIPVKWVRQQTRHFDEVGDRLWARPSSLRVRPA